MIYLARLGRIILIALLIAGAMYATWLFLRPDPVPMVPRRIALQAFLGKLVELR